MDQRGETHHQVTKTGSRVVLLPIFQVWSWRESRSTARRDDALPAKNPHEGETREGETKWSWRESNPRPNKETIRFLHAYSRLRFRALTRPGPPTNALAFKSSSAHQGLCRLFPIYLRRRVLRFGTTPLGRRLVPLPCSGIKPVVYCTSTRQREHTRCCQLIFLQKRFRSLP